MNATAKELMSWPQGIQACYFVNDTNDVLNASAFRVAFIPLLVNKIQIINNSLIFFVVILSLLICAIVVQRYISNSRTQIGVMQANGINKRRIAVSLIPFALLPAIVGGIGGYLIGFFLQNPAINLFSNY
jgi:putative ABC transport system permease protein